MLLLYLLMKISTLYPSAKQFRSLTQGFLRLRYFGLAPDIYLARWQQDSSCIWADISWADISVLA